MMYAEEAREITLKNKNDAAMNEILNKILPIVEDKIRNAAQFGRNEISIKKEELVHPRLGFILFTKKEVMNAVAAKVKRYGYEVSITPSYSSICFKW